MDDRPRTATSAIGRLLAVGVLLLAAGVAGLTPVAHGVADPVVEGRLTAATSERRTRRAVRRPLLPRNRRPFVRRAVARLGPAPRPSLRRRPVLAVTSVLRL